MPDISDGIDLFRHLESIGYIRSTGMDVCGVSYAEIESWQRQTGVNLSSWEAETLFIMSACYANMASKASDEKCPAPSGMETDNSRVKRVTKNIFG